MNELLLIQPGPVLKRIYPKAIWHADRKLKEIFVTFDDGPIPVLTEWVLDELDKYNAKATFFCVGDNIRKHTGIFNRIKASGHLACNHTMHHSRGFRKSTGSYVEEVDACRQLVGNMLFRPPYGQLKRGQYRALMNKGYSVVMWDVISYDYEKISPQKCEENVVSTAREGSIVLFHDNLKAEKNLRHTLPVFLSTFSERGFVFKTLDHVCVNSA